MSRKKTSLFDPRIVRQAAVGSFRKLDPRLMIRNPVMFVVYIGSFLTTGLWLQALVGQGEASRETPGFILAVTLWLWFTVLFANFAEAMAEGRGKAQAAALRNTPDRGREEARGAPPRRSPDPDLLGRTRRGYGRPRRGRTPSGGRRGHRGLQLASVTRPPSPARARR